MVTIQIYISWSKLFQIIKRHEYISHFSHLLALLEGLGQFLQAESVAINIMRHHSVKSLLDLPLAFYAHIDDIDIGHHGIIDFAAAHPTVVVSV